MPKKVTASILSAVPRAKNILVAYDGTDAARRALDAAADLMGYGSLLSVVGVPSALSPAPLAEASRHLSGRHVFARYLERDGAPAETVLDAAAEVGADIIVLGSPNGLSERVLRHADCDVLVVR
jgi:nucleotide-binding universal stress UspA family protein